MDKDRQQTEKKIPNKPEVLLKQQLKRVLKTADGIAVFRYLFNECGYDRPSVVADPTTGEILTNSTNYNEARRNIWVKLRKLMPREPLIMIEIGHPEDAQQ